MFVPNKKTCSKMMKKVIDVDVQSNASFRKLHHLVSQVLEKTMAKEICISTLSYDSVMKRIQEGRLPLNGMENDMKILQSKFYHFYTKEMKEVIIQIHANKMAVFSDE